MQAIYYYMATNLTTTQLNIGLAISLTLFVIFDVATIVCSLKLLLGKYDDEEEE